MTPAGPGIDGRIRVCAVARLATGDWIATVATGVDAVLAEGLEHHLCLGRVLGKVKS